MAHVTMAPGTKRALTRQSIRATLTRASLLKEAETMEPPQQKRKRQFDFMTSDILKSRHMHLLAAQYFSSLGNTVFVVRLLSHSSKPDWRRWPKQKMSRKRLSLNSISQLHCYLPFLSSGNHLQSTGTSVEGQGFTNLHPRR